MIISKTSENINNYKKTELYYKSAREGLSDLVMNLKQNEFISTIFLPSYIGLSPKEGSGIFDAISKVGIDIVYYKMEDDLNIDYKDLFSRIYNIECKNFVVLIVNYFGFRDKNYTEILSEIRNLSGLIIEDNAHGFYTYYNNDICLADATFFSLHKMFPFSYGGSLLLLNSKLKKMNYAGNTTAYPDCNPWLYDIRKISEVRKNNYLLLYDLICEKKYNNIFKPFKKDLNSNVPQSFPIVILNGNRDKVYETMNKENYGVVSLYHTLIDELNNEEYKSSIEISKCIMNLPIHQDVDVNYYKKMVEVLAEACKSSLITM